MSSLTRAMLPAFALAAMMSAAHAQTATDQDHNAHHPDGTASTTTQVQPAPAPPPAPAQPAPGSKLDPAGHAPMMGQGLGIGMVVRPGTQAQGNQPGMMMNMDQMRSKMEQQDGQAGMMPMMRQMMMGQHGGMGMPFEHVEGRIAFLKAELRITDAQASPWGTFADTLRANAKAHQAMHEQMTKGGMPAAWPDRLTMQQKMLNMRLDAVKALETAARPLYAVLTDEQKKLADKLLTGAMGMM
ncbi:Spy/CpxP family protein refolding chaperone [Azospirillum largimobile]